MTSRDQVNRLAELWRERDNLNKVREDAVSRNFWLGVVNEAFSGTGSRSSLASAIGGNGDLASVFMAAVTEEIDQLLEANKELLIEAGGEVE
jgi:hypothetical protein